MLPEFPRCSPYSSFTDFPFLEQLLTAYVILRLMSSLGLFNPSFFLTISILIIPKSLPAGQVSYSKCWLLVSVSLKHPAPQPVRRSITCSHNPSPTSRRSQIAVAQHYNTINYFTRSIHVAGRKPSLTFCAFGIEVCFSYSHLPKSLPRSQPQSWLSLELYGGDYLRNYRRSSHTFLSSTTLRV